MKKITSVTYIHKILLLMIFLLTLMSFFPIKSPTKTRAIAAKRGSDFIEKSDNTTITEQIGSEKTEPFYSSTEQIITLTKFDPRGELTPTKDQGSTNLCWAYAAISASESSILKSKIGDKNTLRLNPQALAYRKYVRSIDPLGNNANYVSNDAGEWTQKAGSIEQTAPLFSMWQGPIGGDKPSADVWENSTYRLESANLISSGQSNKDRIVELKSAIAKYGAVTASCYYDGGTNKYFNDNAVTNGIPHAITLVGWDDNIDSRLFSPGKVSTNGGWLVKNSYDDNGYFWLTYESKISETTSWTFTYATKEEYDFNYYYDNSEFDFGIIKQKKVANVYQAKKGTKDQSEYLKAVNVGFVGNDVSVTIRVYTNLDGSGQLQVERGILSAQKTQIFKYGGYNTIKFDKPLKIDKDSYFSIVVEVSNPTGNAYVRVVQSDSKKPSYYNNEYSGYDYIFNGGCVARVKAYTKLVDSEEKPDDTTVSSYGWNEKRAPLFYGATQIFIDKNVFLGSKEEFVKDSRFRVFAKDFEDGDITHKIKIKENNVQPNIPGQYNIVYEIVDSHNNVKTLNVPVTINDKVGGDCRIIRTIYAVPQMKNLVDMEIGRCDSNNSQILGIYLPKGGCAKVKFISNLTSEVDDLYVNPTITCYTDTGRIRTSTYLNVKEQQEIEVKCEIDDMSYDAVPLINAPRLKDEKVDVTFEIELVFNASDAKPLTYYHYKDSTDDEFYQKWNNSNDTYAVIDGNSSIIVLHIYYRNYLNGAWKFDNPIGSLDQVLEYYDEVISRMDKMIGLELNAKDTLNQNYPTKFTIVEDEKTASGAYYLNSSLISIGQKSMQRVFSYWYAILHEIGHGYQGRLGNGGNMKLKETGNNVFVYYIIKDSSLFKGNPKENHLGGTLEETEERWNQKRIAGEEIFIKNDSGWNQQTQGYYTNTQEKLFALVNLFDAFEGDKTYGKLFTYYRELIKKGQNYQLLISEIFATFFADEYKADIISYFESWKITVSPEVKKYIKDQNLNEWVIFSDIIDNGIINKIIEMENPSRKYGLVNITKYAQYHIHVWGEPTYVWSFDNAQVTASQVCKYDNTHIQTETVSTVATTIKQPTCIEKGKIKYESVQFKNCTFVIQEKIIETNYDEHQLGNLVPEVFSTCTKKGMKAHYKCSICENYFDINKTKITLESLEIPINENNHEFGIWKDEVPATTTENGVKGHKDCIECKRHFDIDGNELTNLTIAKIDTYKVTINGKSKFYTNGAIVKIIADEPEKGMIFKGWINDNGEIVSKYREYNFVVNGETNLTALYENDSLRDEIGTNTNKHGLSNDVIVSIVIGIVVILGFGGFAILFCTIKKKFFRNK